MQFGGAITYAALTCAATVAAIGAVVAMAPSERVAGPLTADEAVGVYTTVLGERLGDGSNRARRYLVDVRDQLTPAQRSGITLRYPAEWARLKDLDTQDSAPGAMLVDALYPATVANGAVTVRIGQLCGHRCGSGTTYVLARAGLGRRIVDRVSAQSG